jgi:hypothetical protein
MTTDGDMSQNFESMINDAFPDRMISNWIMIVECVESDSKNLNITSSEGMTTWLASGMLTCASDIILNESYEFAHDESSDDD